MGEMLTDSTTDTTTLAEWFPSTGEYLYMNWTTMNKAALHPTHM